MASGILGTLPVVILAGGLGTRLRPVLPNQPKGLAPIGAYSFLEIQIQLLRDQGVRDFVLCVGYQAEKIQSALGDGRAWGVHIDYSVEGECLLGTAGALRLAERHFTPRALVLNGDTYCALDYTRFVERHLAARRRGDVLATLALARAADGARYGNVALDASQRYVVGFREKEAVGSGTDSWLSAGAYVIEREMLQLVPAGKPCSLERAVFPGVLAAGRRIACQTAAERFFDIGTPEALQTFTEFYLELQNGERGSVYRAAG